MPLHSLHKGKLVEDQTVLSDLGVQGGQTVQVGIQSADPVNKPLKYTRVSTNLQTARQSQCQSGNW